MKKIVLSLALVSLSALTFAQKTSATVAKFASETIDLGKIKQGTPTKGTFTVTNISGAPLIIEQANPTCGCTISDFTKSPIAAGKTGTIDATYNAANAGHFEKHLTVKFAGVDDVKSITLTGDVLSADEFAKYEAENAAKVKPVEVKAAEPVVAKVKTTTKKAVHKKYHKKTTSKTTKAPATKVAPKKAA